MREQPHPGRRQASGNPTFSHLKSRLFAAVVMVLITATVMIPGLASYLPLHRNDAVGLPILLFPIIWSVLFIYCFMESSMKRLWSVLLVLFCLHLGCIYLALMG